MGSEMCIRDSSRAAASWQWRGARAARALRSSAGGATAGATSPRRCPASAGANLGCRRRHGGLPRNPGRGAAAGARPRAGRLRARAGARRARGCPRADGRGFREHVRKAAALPLRVASGSAAGEKGHPREAPPVEVPHRGSARPVRVFCVEEGRAGSAPGPARAVSSGSGVYRRGRGAFGSFAAPQPEVLPRHAGTRHHKCDGARS